MLFNGIRTFDRDYRVQPQWFMSDDADQYFIPWLNNFGRRPRKLLCTCMTYSKILEESSQRYY